MPNRILKRREFGLNPRNRKFKRRIRTIMIEALRINGIGVYTACDYAGINYQTHRDWMTKGKDKKKYPTCAWYRRQIKRTIAEKEIEALNIIREVAKGGERILERKIVFDPEGGKTTTRIIKRKGKVWQASAWYLERLHPDKYGRESTVHAHIETPEEKAQQIKEALDIMTNSVPLAPLEEQVEEEENVY